ncbi:MAG TPA: TonB-dependent receptor [Vicinamibacteria bacterium]|nr:TonB-dependent receptor [Vicinamibacteria bacterium]
MSRLRLAFITLSSLAATVPLLAQATTTAITGTVRDASRTAVAGALVTARHLETGLARSVPSQADGRYVLPALPVGAYELRVEMTGFRPLLRRGVTLAVGEPAVVDLVLELGAFDQEITVTAETSSVRTGSAELSYLVGERAIHDLPLNGRNYTDLAFLQPGVVAYTHRDTGSVVAHGVGMSVNGQDPRSNTYLLDGTLLNDFTNGPAGSAAGTALGTETVREFRVETNSYSAEFGRNSGGQIHVITKSGGNDLHGSAYQFHRNDALDARNFFDLPGAKPDFRRNQFGATLGGPLRRDRTFFFFGYEALRERLGRTLSTFVPDTNARQGLLPDGAGGLRSVGVSPDVRPYLDAFPLPNGPAIGQGLATFTFPFEQDLRQDFFQVRLDQNVGGRDQLFARYTFDDAEHYLPTDFPQFPRTFLSRNQFFTGEYRHVASPRTLHTTRLGYSRTRIGQAVEANLSTPLPPFTPGREIMGDIDIGGVPRFGPQSSGNLSLVQNVYALEHGLVHTRGRHFIKAGALAEHYRQNMVNPTFSLGIFAFGNVESFLRNAPLRFVGLTPDAALDRYWRFTLFGLYLQDDVRLGHGLTLNAGLRYEYQTLPRDTKGRDSTMITLADRTPTTGRLYENPFQSLSPRLGLAWDPLGDGRSSLRAGYGLYFNTNSYQNLIVTVTNPPATPRIIIPNPTFPVPPFTRAIANSIRPVQWDLQVPRVHVWNLSAQRELLKRTVLTVGYAGSRGRHLLRSGDVNVPVPQRLADGTLFYPPTAAKPNTAFGVIEQKTSDGNSWYHALIVELARRAAGGLSFQSSYTFSRNIDTTQASTFFSDATNGTTSAFPEPFGLPYNKGLADYHAKHNWVFNLTWDLPLARNAGGFAGALFGDWQLAAIGQIRSGNPLTAFVQANRSRSRWSPSLAPNVGLDRPSLAPGRTPADAVLGQPTQWFDPAAFVLQPAGTLGNLGRGALIGPDLRVVDLALVKRIPLSRLGDAGRLELRVEAFNVFNRVNLGVPALQAFAGASDGEAVLPTFGRIRTTSTSARQIQVGARVSF